MFTRTLEKTAEMAGGSLIQAENPKKKVTSVSMDTRSLESDALYVPLIATRDGHDYIDKAIENGAAAALWQKDHLPRPENLPLIVVDDTLEALQLLAKNYLSELDLVQIGVTGSNGKTSTKDFLCSIFNEGYGKTQKTQGNRNNEIGFPLTVLDLDEDTKAAILEMGMENLGEIDFLASMCQLDGALVVSVGDAHLENLGSRQNIAKAKCEILHGLKPDGVFVWHANSPELKKELDETELDPKWCLKSFGSSDQADYRRDETIEHTNNGIAFKCEKLSERPFEVNSFMDFQADNALAAAVLAASFGIDEKAIRKGLLNADLTPHRGQQIMKNRACILDDTYKSNPQAVKEAMLAASKKPGSLHIACLGDMLDMGEASQDLHYQAGLDAKEAGMDLVFAYGPESAATAKAFGKNGYHFQTKEELVKAVRPYLDQNSVILVKGSRGMKMEDVIEGLLQEE